MVFKSIKDFLKSINSLISNFSTGLINIINEPEDQQIYKLQGSGTFVRIGETFGVLTAYHVSKELQKGSETGFILFSDNKAHKFSIPSNEISFLDLAIPENEEYGPDISFLRLPNEKIGPIKANKSFYDLSLHHKNYQTFIDEINMNKNYASWGMLRELTTKELPEFNITNVIGLHGRCMLSLMTNYFQTSNHDYIDLDVDFSLSTSDFPRTLKGISGGGIWLIDYQVDKNKGEIYLLDFFYCGINFFQTEITEDNHRKIRGHSWKSVYSFSFNELLKIFS